MSDARNRVFMSAACSGGVARYLNEVHRSHRLRYLQLGILSGALMGAATYFGSRYFSYPPGLATIPAAVGVLGSSIVGLMTQDANDAEHAEAFEETCAHLAELDTQDEEDEADGNQDDPSV